MILALVQQTAPESEEEAGNFIPVKKARHRFRDNCPFDPLFWSPLRELMFRHSPVTSHNIELWLSPTQLRSGISVPLRYTCLPQKACPESITYGFLCKAFTLATYVAVAP